MAKLRFYGQACFSLEHGGTTLIFDPYLSANPAKIAKPTEVHPDYIFVTHGHADHLGDTLELAIKNQATIITTAEMGRFLESQADGLKIEPMHVGGQWKFPFGKVKVTPAIHGAGIPGGIACGFLVDLDTVVIYFAGDTALFSDMKLIGRRKPIDYALLPIGDRFTMGPEDAADAAALLGARNVIPMHYNGNVRTKQDPRDFAKLVAQCCDSEVVIMEPGETIDLS